MSDHDRSANSSPQITIDWKEEPPLDPKEDASIQAFMDRFLRLLRAIGGKPKEQGRS
jgi:hypothetical protein